MDWRAYLIQLQQSGLDSLASYLAGLLVLATGSLYLIGRRQAAVVLAAEIKGVGRG